MTRAKLYMAAAILIVVVSSACSKEENITEKAAKEVDQITTKAADKAVKKIRTPINKAKMTRQLGDERVKAIDESLKNQ